MARYVGAVTSPRSPDEVFDYMADFANVRDWDPSVVRAAVLAGTPGELGCRFEVVVRTLGRETALVYETKQVTRPSRIVLEAQTAALTSVDVVTVTALGEGTEMTYDADLRLRGPLRLVDPVLALFFRQLGDKAAAGLRRELGR
ncbi:MAG: SRPBCC family protein [Solirubrobacterales bacterium]|nr:SRPBCC family protein [Solirubrobacterales bacterium]